MYIDIDIYVVSLLSFITGHKTSISGSDDL